MKENVRCVTTSYQTLIDINLFHYIRLDAIAVATTSALLFSSAHNIFFSVCSLFRKSFCISVVKFSLQHAVHFQLSMSFLFRLCRLTRLRANPHVLMDLVAFWFCFWASIAEQHAKANTSTRTHTHREMEMAVVLLCELPSMLFIII